MRQFLFTFEAIESRIASYSCPKGTAGRVHTLRLRRCFQSTSLRPQPPIPDQDPQLKLQSEPRRSQSIRYERAVPNGPRSSGHWSRDDEQGAPEGDADNTSNGLAEPNFRPAYRGRQWIPKVGTEENLSISETGSGDTVSAKFQEVETSGQQSEDTLVGVSGRT